MQGESAVLGTEDFSQLEFNYSPNPAKDNLTINANASIESLQLFDVQGRLLVTEITNSHQANINISNYSNGVYFLKVNSEMGAKKKKIIKE